MKREKIIEIGALRVLDGQVQETFHTLINPRRKLRSETIELTGITDEMVALAPDIEEVIGRFLTFSQEIPLVGHRILFDHSF